MSGFFIDGMRVPQLFHMLVGGGVIHPGVIDGLEFFGGAYDVTYGRQNGGVAAARTRAARDDRHHLEAELRLLDVSLLVELKLPRGVRVSLSGHYGYPGPILHAIDKRIDLNSWDYHLRIDWSGFTLQALGSYDTESFAFGDIAMGLQVPSMHMTFHRIQLRKRVQGPRLYAEAALVGGFEQAGSSREKAVHKVFIRLRANLQLRVSRFTL